MKMHDNIPANWRTCVGALQTRTRANSDPQQGQKWPRHLDFVCRSETKVRMRVLVQSPRSRVYLSAPNAVRMRESVIADYAPQACLCSGFEKTQVHKQALARKRRGGGRAASPLDCHEGVDGRRDAAVDGPHESHEAVDRLLSCCGHVRVRFVLFTSHHAV